MSSLTWLIRLKKHFFPMQHRRYGVAAHRPRRFIPRLEMLEGRWAPSVGFWDGYAGDPQHDAISDVASQPLNTIRWQTPVDLNPPNSGGSLLIHYGSPSVTADNTVIIPVKTGAANGFKVEGRNGADGTLLWSQTTDYLVPPHNWFPSYSSVLTPGGRFYFAGAGGTVYYRDNPDAAGAGVGGQLSFAGMANYLANKASFDANVYINTPLTADSAGNIYFGFQVIGSVTGNPTLQSGIARIAADGTATYTTATAAAGNPSPAITKMVANAAPALSNDGQTLYVALDDGTNGSSNRGYLAAVNSTTLAYQSRVRLKDPNGNDANLPDNGSGAPTVGPDGDVYFGVLDNPVGTHHYRGWLLHYSSDLSVTKTPGSFGWDVTASIVPTSMVPTYAGSSPYLLMTKYNSYAQGGGGGQNKVAILDPNDTMIDSAGSGLTVMKEILTILGPTIDTDYPSLPDARREWCINTAVVDPATKSILVNNEDGKLYRWYLPTNSFTQVVTLTAGLGEAYTPTLIGADGTVYAINNAILFAVGKSKTTTGLTDDGPNPATVTQALSLTVTVSGGVPNGEIITLKDASNDNAIVPTTGNTLNNGSANLVVAAGTLSAGTHNLFAVYDGDTNFSGSQSTQIAQVVNDVPPTVSSVTINGNNTALAGNQRGRVASLQIVFDQAVSLDIGAFALSLHANVTVNGVLQSTYGSLPSNLNVSGSGTTWVVTFVGNTDNGITDGFNSIKEGVYDLIIDGSKVHPAGSPGVSMSGTYTTTFGRVLGDGGGSTQSDTGVAATNHGAIAVNASDKLAFLTAFNTTVGHSGYFAWFDFDGNGAINAADKLAFLTNFNKSVSW